MTNSSLLYPKGAAPEPLAIDSATPDKEQSPAKRRHRLLHPKPASPPHPSAHAPNHNPSAAEREASVRAARAEIRAHVRNDWTWPPDSNAPPQDLRIDPENTLWREAEPNSSSDEEGVAVVASDEKYPFETPDSVAEVLRGRKRKRREVVREEMEWNEGLRTWMERRTAWTGAKEVDCGDGEGGSAGGLYKLPPFSSDALPIATPVSPSSNQLPHPRPPSPAQVSTPSSSSTTITTDPSSANTSTTNTTSASTSTSTSTSISLQADHRTLLPLPPPLLSASHPIRAAITPLVYPTIYSRVVVQSTTPTVPINLADMTRALVQGWKKDGEWPPKNTEKPKGQGVEVEGRRKGDGAGEERRRLGGMRRVMRGLGIGEGGGGAEVVREMQ